MTGCDLIADYFYMWLPDSPADREEDHCVGVCIGDLPKALPIWNEAFFLWLRVVFCRKQVRLKQNIAF